MVSDPLNKLCWDDLRIVKAIGESGGLAAAAAQVGVNQSTVFRRLAEIEGSLDVTLFERRRSGYVATPMGSEVIALAKRLEIDIVAVTSRLSSLKQEPAGELRIATSDTLALHLLTPIFASFKALHPAVRVEVIVGNSSLNLARGESDIAIRATNAPPENLVGRKVATIAWAAYGRSEDFREGSPSADALHDRAWATYGDELSSLKAVRFVGSEVPPQNIVYRINTVEGVSAGIVAGLGAGYLPCFLGDRIPELVRIAPVNPKLSDDLWLLTHPDLRKSGRVHAFLDYCATAIGKQRALIEGRGVPLARP